MCEYPFNIYLVAERRVECLLAVADCGGSQCAESRVKKCWHPTPGCYGGSTNEPAIGILVQATIYYFCSMPQTGSNTCFVELGGTIFDPLREGVLAHRRTLDTSLMVFCNSIFSEVNCVFPKIPAPQNHHEVVIHKRQIKHQWSPHVWIYPFWPSAGDLYTGRQVIADAIYTWARELRSLRSWVCRWLMVS